MDDVIDDLPYSRKPVWLTSQSPEIIEFLNAWREADRAGAGRHNKKPSHKHPAERKKATNLLFYIACDTGTQRIFAVDRVTRDVWWVGAHGILGRRICTLAELTATYREICKIRGG